MTSVCAFKNCSNELPSDPYEILGSQLCMACTFDIGILEEGAELNGMDDAKFEVVLRAFLDGKLQEQKS